MFITNNKNRIRIIKVYLWLNGVFLLFWWPLSHWFYTNFYHQLLGFTTGSYQDSMVKVIGTCGVFPVIICFLTAKNPIRNRDSVFVLVILGFLIALTFWYLIVKGYFPEKEFINVSLSLFSAFFLILVYPWKKERN